MERRTSEPRKVSSVRGGEPTDCASSRPPPLANQNRPAPNLERTGVALASTQRSRHGQAHACDEPRAIEEFERFRPTRWVPGLLRNGAIKEASPNRARDPS